MYNDVFIRAINFYKALSLQNTPYFEKSGTGI